MKRLLLSIFFTAIFMYGLNAQVDSLYTPETEVSPLTNNSSSLLMKSFVSLGAGPMTYYGDMHRYKGTNALMGNWGVSLGFGVRATEYLDGQLFFNSGWISFTENTLQRQANFKSKILSGGILFTYNFENFFKETPTVHPLIILGISNVEFNSKSDLYDSQGRYYNYWSDGSIRDLPENHPNSDQSIELIRDNIFESDLRALDLDDLGNYDLSTLAIPFGIGADISLDHGFSLRISSIMNFTFSDNIDNISSSGSGNRAGDSRNDRYLYTSVSLHYDLSSLSKRGSDAYGGAYFGDTDDEDSDGVIDLFDNCPFTPEGVQVDEFGCPLDGDGDWVADYKDMELDSPEGSTVDTSGVALSDDDIYQLYMAYMDTSGSFTNIVKTVYTSNEQGRRTKYTPRPQSKYYSIQIATADEDLSIDQIGKILSISDVRVINDSNETYYIVGQYDQLEFAVEQKILLEVDGIIGEVISMVNEHRVTLNEEVKEIEDQYRLEGGFSNNQSLISKDVIYRVQIGAFKNPLSKNVFEGVRDLIVLSGDDGLTRYLTGSYSTIENAADRKIDVLLDGFEGAFIVAYKGGKRQLELIN